MLIDSHCHFDFPEFDSRREAIWQSCLQKGLSALIVPGVNPVQWKTSAKMCQHHADFHFSVGLHPYFLEQSAPSDLGRLKQMLIQASEDKKCVAIGECGLDSSIKFSFEKQKAILDLHIDVSNLTAKPLILHCVKAQNELLRVLNSKPTQYGGVIHGYSGSVEMALEFWKRGFRIGLGGVVTYPRAKKTRKCASALPVDAILLETDAPSMPLYHRQGKANSPEYLTDIADKVASLRCEDIEYIADKTSANARLLFNI